MATSRSRYKFFDTVWNDDISHNQKGMQPDDFDELFQTENDILYPIPLEHRYRPDSIAKKFYGV